MCMLIASSYAEKDNNVNVADNETSQPNCVIIIIIMIIVITMITIIILFNDYGIYFNIYIYMHTEISIQFYCYYYC